MDAEEAAVRAYYERGEERDRLSDGRGQLEFVRTTEIIARRLPPPPAIVADIGGGPGRYVLWLASLGYQVEHRDMMPLHVRQVQAASARVPGIRTAVGDARQIDLPDASADAVLLLGPLYHLARRADRAMAISEAARVLRPGGTLFAVAISRWAARIDGIIGNRIYLVSVEGPAMILPDLDARMADPADRGAILDQARALESVCELVGFGPHLLATGTRARGTRA